LHQKAFGGRAPPGARSRTYWGSLSAPPDPLAAIWRLTSKGRRDERGKGRGRGSEGERKEKESPHFFVQVYAQAVLSLEVLIWE